MAAMISSLLFLLTIAVFLMSFISTILYIVLLISINLLFKKEEAVLRMRVTTQEVELFCKMSLLPFMLCLGYDLILVVLCAAHAFLTRNLPDNFSESWYLFVSVSTTSFLWIVFLPTLFVFVCKFILPGYGVLDQI